MDILQRSHSPFSEDCRIRTVIFPVETDSQVQLEELTGKPKNFVSIAVISRLSSESQSLERYDMIESLHRLQIYELLYGGSEWLAVKGFCSSLLMNMARYQEGLALYEKKIH
jgi:hypothetical protein